MKKILFSFTLFCLVAMHALAQTPPNFYKFKTEAGNLYLLQNMKLNTFTMYSDVDPTGRLIKVKQKKESGADASYELFFEGAPDVIYKVSVSDLGKMSSRLVWVNPDGSKHYYSREASMEVYAHGKDASQEVLLKTDSGMTTYYIHVSTKTPFGLLLKNESAPSIKGDQALGFATRPNDTCELTVGEKQLTLSFSNGEKKVFDQVFAQ